MNNFIEWVIAVFLAFLLVVLGPLMIVQASEYSYTKRLVLNEMSRFLDKVSDKGYITDDDIDLVYLAVNASGGVFDVTIKRHILVSSLDSSGNISSTYLVSRSTGELNVTDLVEIEVKEVGIHTFRKLMGFVLNIYISPMDISLATGVR